MSLVYSFNAGLNGSYIDPISGDAGTNTNGVFRRTEKGIAWYNDGSAGSVDYTSVNLSRLSSTIVINFKFKNLDVQQPLIGGGSGGVSYIRMTTSTTLRAESNTNADDWINKTSFSPTLNEWHQLIIVADSGTVNTYYDNVLLDTKTPSDDLTWQFIGRSGTNYLDGFISTVKVYNHPFTAQERSQAYERFLQASPLITEKFPKTFPEQKPKALNDPNLIAAYNMIPSEGTLVDISGNGNNGTLRNNLVSNKDGLVFDGVDQAVDCPDIEMDGWTELTIAARIIDKGANGAANDRRIISKDQQGIQGAWILAINAANDLLFSVHDGTAFRIATWVSYATSDSPRDIVAILNGANLTIYVDGVSVATSSDMTAGIDDADNEIITIGADSDPTTKALMFNGEIQDVKIYNYAFTEQQAKDYSNSWNRVVFKEDFSDYAVGWTL